MNHSIPYTQCMCISEGLYTRVSFLFLCLCSTTAARKPVTATSDVQLSAMRSRIAELKAQIRGGGDRDSAPTGSLGVSCEGFNRRKDRWYIGTMVASELVLS